MSCYFAPPLRLMARNIRVARARAQPVPLSFLFKNSPIIAHFSHIFFQLLFPALDTPSSSYKTSAAPPRGSAGLSPFACTILLCRY